MSSPVIVNKVKDLDKLLNEYEFNFSSFKLKQQSLEKRIEVLEREFIKLKQPFHNKTNDNNNTNSNQLTGQKLIAIEKSHRILEKELKLLKDLQRNDLESIKENIDLLQTQIIGEAILSQSFNNLQELQKNAGTVDYLQQQCADIQERLIQLRKRKKDNIDMQKNYGELKSEMRNQFNSLVEDRRLFELEKNLLTKDFENLNAGNIQNDTTQILNTSIIQESIIELELKADEWEQKYKNELDSFNIQSQQQDQQIKQLKEQLLAAKLNNEAKNLDLTNQLKLLNDDENELLDVNIIKSSTKEKLQDDINEKSLTQISSVNNFSDNEINKQVLINNDLINATLNKKSNLNDSIIELEGRLNEWGSKYNKEIDSFNKQQKEQILLNKKEETQIKLLKEQITAAKIVSESDEVINYDLVNNSKRTTIKESILSLEAKFNHLEQIYNNESVFLDNKLKTISTTNLNTSNSNLKLSNQNFKIPDSHSKLELNIQESKALITSIVSCHSLKSEQDFIRVNKSNSAESIFILEAKVIEWEKKHQREIEIFNILSQQQEIQIKDLKEKLSSEALQVENLNTDYCILQSEANRLENALKLKCDNLEIELNETNKLNDYECELAMKNRKLNETYENYDKEIKSLIEQISHLVCSPFH